MTPVDIVFEPLFWAVLVIVFAVVELTTTGLVAAFLAAGAFITMFLVYFRVVDSLSGLALGYTLSTLVAAALLWFPLRRFYIGRKTTDEEEGLVAFIGDHGVVADGELTARGGVIRIHGARMAAVLAAESPIAALAAGADVKVIGRDRLQRLVVTPTA